MRGLFGKYVALIAGLVTLVLVASSALGLYFLARQNESQLVALQHEKAAAAATRIELYVKDIEHEMGWTALPKAAEQGLAQRKLEYLKLLRQVPAITDVAWVDAQGRERLRMSRLTMDIEESGTNQFASAFFRQARAGRTFFSPVYFRKNTEPYMTIARRAGDESEGVIVAEVNLKFVWDVITQIKVGKTGLAYVVDSAGNLVAHPDISLVLQKTSMLPLQHVAALSPVVPDVDRVDGSFVRNLQGEEVLSAAVPVPGLGWNVFVELPREEALQPLYGLVWRGAILLVAGVLIAVVASILLARRMVRPIRALQAGAHDIGAGLLDRRIEVRTGDEIETLAAQFNTMTGQLRESYATLEQKVADRTQAAESASLAKSRFLAAASHDLRQPMHALNLYLGALSAQELPPASRRLLSEVRQCAQTMDDLFESLLDISKLDANAVEPELEVFEMDAMLERIGMEFEPQARLKGLRLRVRPCRCRVRGDPALVERILRNLVSNAVRYTVRGKVLVGCRRSAAGLRVAVYDTGPGIAPEEQALVFEEFYQVGNPERDRGKGLGLGLSIVQRLARLLDVQITLASTVGRGSYFSVVLPLAGSGAMADRTGSPEDAVPQTLSGALVVVVDDEAAVLQATRYLLQEWGCEVVSAGSGGEAIERLTASSRVPDLLLCDYRLRGGETGLDVVEALRDEFNREVPALIVTGDVMPESMELSHAAGFAVLHKPVPDRVLRDTMARLVGAQSGALCADEVPSPSRRAARTA